MFDPKLDSHRRAAPPVTLPGGMTFGQVVKITLTGTLVEDDFTTGAPATVGYWDRTANNGEGAYRESADTFQVYDVRKVGYYGSSGTHGAAILRPCDKDPGVCGEICDLHCP